MEYVLLRNIDKNIVYYGVYSTESENCDGSDILCTARKKYFETKKQQHGRNILKTPYETFRYKYSIEDGVPLKFKKLHGSQQIERVVVTGSGYCVETYDYEKHPIKKAFYNNHHIWLKTDFYSLRDKSMPIFALSPAFDDDSPVIVCKTKNGKSSTLYPFNISLDKEYTEKLNIITNEPRFFAVTSCGSFYFCTMAEYRERKKALDSLIQKEKETALSEDPITEKTGFTVDESALNDNPDSFRLSDSKEIYIDRDDPDSSKDKTDKTDSDGGFFAKIEEIAKKNNLDILPSKAFDADNNTDSALAKEEAGEYTAADIPEAAALSDNAPAGDNTEEKAEPDTGYGDSSTVAAEAADTDEQPDADNHKNNENITDSDNDSCSLGAVCPYEFVDKQIIESGGQQYIYFGEMDGTMRHGRGRTVMGDGNTAYEGGYINDKRDGFGVYYYKSGKLCYAGNWQANKRQGLGVAFSAHDGSAFIGKWNENHTDGIGSGYDRDGRMTYTGCMKDGKRAGAGITYDYENKTFFVGKYKDGEFLGTGTQFSIDGDLLYTGGFDNNKRSGMGTSYDTDGMIVYKGEWKNNKYNGSGTLYLKEGGALSGMFRDGKANGKCTLTDKENRIIYIGSFVNDNYNGSGRLYNDNGGWAEGRFVDGEPTGIFNEYDRDKNLVYCGEWADMHRNGRGIEYRNGQKMYEGDFVNSVYNGQGRLFCDGRQIYSGSFKDGKRNGCGTEFDGEKVVYRGMWKDDKYCGSGIVYSDGSVVCVGEFENGCKHGRINEVEDDRVVRKCIYTNGVMTYMCSFTRDGSLQYYGGVRDNIRNGMGCSFENDCEKQFEGIFRSGRPEKPMKVTLKELYDIAPCPELDGTEFELYRTTPQYIIEKNIRIGSISGIYTGRLSDGLPDGGGTILLDDHRYTGMFTEGRIRGKGILYKNDGTEYSGYFSDEPFAGCEALIFDEITYYFKG